MLLLIESLTARPWLSGGLSPAGARCGYYSACAPRIVILADQRCPRRPAGSSEEYVFDHSWTYDHLAVSIRPTAVFDAVPYAGVG